MSALGALAAAAAHELGSPLSTIAVVAKEMLREVEPDDPLREDVELLSAESDRCRSILARLSVDPAGDVSDAYVLVPLPALIEAAAQNYKRDGIAITFEVRADRRGRADHRADPAAQPRDHAGHRQHRSERRVVRHATRSMIATRWTTEWSEVEVSDDGPGFSEALLDELGTPFISTRQGVEGHMGLGVFIAKTLLERTGASVSFGNRSAGTERRRGGRALAKSRLQGYIAADVRRRGHELTQAPPAQSRPSSPARRTHKDRTLLIADDDAAFRNRIARALELRGFIVTAVGSVAEALAQTARPPAFAVLDLRLGDGNGLELVGPLRQARPDIRIVVLTGYGNIATAVAAVKEGAVDYLAKPADADAIEQALTAHGRKLPPPPSATRCRPTACAGSTSSASSSSATATSRRRRAASTCTGAPCSASWASTRPASTDRNDHGLITVQLLLNALALGMAYALVALGFVLALNASGAVNFAHGDLVVLGGAVAVFARPPGLGLPGFLLLPLVALALGLAGVLAAHIAILPLARRPPEATFVATIALAAIIEQGLTVDHGRRAAHGAGRSPAAARSRSRASRSAASRWRSSLVGGVLVAAVWFLLERTQTGRRMRAVAADRHMARAVGIPVGRYVTLSLALAGALAGVAGFLLGHQFLVTPTQGAGHMLKAYIAVALGGWGSVPGALLGALGIGVFETFVSAEVGDAWASAALYIAVLARAGVPAAGPVRRAGRPARLICVSAVLAAPAGAAADRRRRGPAAVRPAHGDAGRHLCAAGAGLSARVRPARALNLAQGALFGVGAYAAALTAPYVGALAPASSAIVAAAIAAALAAAPMLRLQSHYFALATLALASLVNLVAVHAESLTGGANGLVGFAAGAAARPDPAGDWSGSA